MSSDKVIIPHFRLDVGELLAFRTWSASGWIRIMYYVSLACVALLFLLELIFIGYQPNAWLMFFGITAILLCCVGSVLYQRIFFEMIIGCLQIPRLTIAVNKLEQAMRREIERKHGAGVQVLESVEDVTVNID